MNTLMCAGGDDDGFGGANSYIIQSDTLFTCAELVSHELKGLAVVVAVRIVNAHHHWLGTGQDGEEPDFTPSPPSMTGRTTLEDICRRDEEIVPFDKF